MEEWSNNACLGYIISGLMNKGWTTKEIKEVVDAVHGEFDFLSIEEAKNVYEKSTY